MVLKNFTKINLKFQYQKCYLIDQIIKAKNVVYKFKINFKHDFDQIIKKDSCI